MWNCVGFLALCGVSISLVCAGGFVVATYTATRNYSQTTCSSNITSARILTAGPGNWKGRALTTEIGTGLEIMLMYPALPGAEVFVWTSHDSVANWLTQLSNRTALQCFVAAKTSNTTRVTGITQHYKLSAFWIIMFGVGILGTMSTMGLVAWCCLETCKRAPRRYNLVRTDEL